MKKTLILLTCFALLIQSPLYSQQQTEANTWQLLEQQGADLLAGIKKQETHPLHALDAAIGKETTDLQAEGMTLTPEKKKLYEEGLKKLAELAHGIHVDGHHKQWDEAAKKQAEFIVVLKKTAALLSEKKISGK